METFKFLKINLCDASNLIHLKNPINRRSKVHVYLQRLGRLDQLAQLAARYFDDANNACCDLGHAHATRVASCDENFDGLGAAHVVAFDWVGHSSLVHVGNPFIEKIHG